MVKGSHGKSSATSGTRKKHAKKAAGASADEPHPPHPKEKRATKKERGQKKKEPRIKVYIPPVKPAPVQPDPLETTGLVHKLPPELLVVLRSFNKKSSTTKIKALEDLMVHWVDKTKGEGEEGTIVYVLLDMLPVWIHHLPSLLIHPSRRVRSLASSIHHSLTQLPTTRDYLLTYLSEIASPNQLEFILGTWSLSTHDVDRSTSVVASKSWTGFIAYQPNQEEDIAKRKLFLGDTQSSSLINFLTQAILDPNGIYQYLNPPAPPPPPPPHTGKKGVRRVPEKEAETPTRSKAEEVEEEEVDRNARLRVEALYGMKDVLDVRQGEPTEEIMELMRNPALWTSLYYGERSPVTPDMESFGFGQPNVRKAAWGLVGAVQESWKDKFGQILPILAPAVLRAAWVEPDTNVHGVMLPQLLKFLRGHPEAWEVERTHIYDEDDEDQSDGEDEGEEGAKAKEEDKQASQLPKAYEEFLQFLSSGCAGSAILGYPAIIVILSTIPYPILARFSSTPLQTLFTSFWKAMDSRSLSGLHRTKTSGKFLDSLLESLVFLVKRAHRQAASGDVIKTESLDDLVVGQVEKVWATVVELQTLVVDQEEAGQMMARALVDLASIDNGICKAAWDTLAKNISQSIMDYPSIVLSILQRIDAQLTEYNLIQAAKAEEDRLPLLEDATPLVTSVRTKAAEEFKRSVETAARDGEWEGLSKEVGEVVRELIVQVGSGIWADVGFTQIVDLLFANHALLIATRSPDLFKVYLKKRGESGQPVDRLAAITTWRNFLYGIADSLEIGEAALREVVRGMGIARDGGGEAEIPVYLTPTPSDPDGEGEGGEIDELVTRLVVEVINGDRDQAGKYSVLVKGIVGHADHFLSEAGYAEVVQTITTSLATRVQAAVSFTGEDALPEGTNQAMSLFNELYLFAGSVGLDDPDQPIPRVLPFPDLTAAMPDVFAYAYLLPEVYGGAVNKDLVKQGKQFMQERSVQQLAQDGDVVLSTIAARLKEMIPDTTCRISPQAICRLYADYTHELSDADIVSDLFPSPETFDQLLSALPAEPLHPSLAVLFPLIRPDSDLRAPRGQAFDNRGFSSYARVVGGLLQLFVEQRKLAKQHIWALRHFHSLRVYALDLLSVLSEKSSVFKPDISPSELESILAKVDQITAYVMNGEVNERWHVAALSMLLDQKAPSQPLGALGAFLVVVINVARQGDKSRDVRVLRNLLQHVFQDVTKEDAEGWVGLARKVEASAPYTSMAIVSAVAEYAPEPLRLDRYRNELAASLMSIRSAKANTEGLLALLKLSYSAPDPDGEVVFLPQPRAVNVMKACQQWIASDEDIDEELESAMTLIAFHLAPLLQDVPGAHWDLIFDLIENNLEAASLTDDMTLVSLARTLRLVNMVQNLVATNKSLRADWESRKSSVLKTIKDLAAIPLSGLGRSQPRSTCRELILSIVEQLPSSLMDHETLPQMSHLITDPSIEVQKIAYQFLRRAAKKTTEHAVIEAGVETEGETSAQIPAEIIQILQRTVDVAEMSSESVFSYLLGWMLLFDLFEDASLKVRSSYIDQLRKLDLFDLQFIPTIIHLLSLDQGPLKSFKLSIWSVDEYYIEHFDTALDFSIPVLAAHLYYRALLTVPSLISSWVLELKDRQLSTSISTYTSQNFSPVLVRTELEHVKAPESMAQFIDASDPDKSLKVKVASNVNEVSAAYAVDEHQLEIRLKIPTDWPLHRIEVKDAKRVGVDENRWRAWLLAVQQIIWSHNGRIVDGLCHFKNNVTGHFEGQVECAICYSIISVMDGTLPKKPCRTCKNRFHAGCLYKWFNTSHSSSCPLCRSDIF